MSNVGYFFQRRYNAPIYSGLRRWIRSNISAAFIMCVANGQMIKMLHYIVSGEVSYDTYADALNYTWMIGDANTRFEITNYLLWMLDRPELKERRIRRTRNILHG